MKSRNRFEETKIQMVMKLHGVSRPAAIDIINGKAAPETDEKKSVRRAKKRPAGILSRDRGEPDIDGFLDLSEDDFMPADEFFGA